MGRVTGRPQLNAKAGAAVTTADNPAATVVAAAATSTRRIAVPRRRPLWFRIDFSIIRRITTRKYAIRTITRDQQRHNKLSRTRIALSMIGTDGVRKCRPIVAIRLRYTQNIGLGVWFSAITPKFGGGDRVTDNVASYEV